MKKPLMNIEDLVNSYLYEKTWLVRENANTFKTFSGLFGFVAQEILKNYALFSSNGYPREQVEAHVRGDIHIHDLPFARFIAYCAGWSLERLFRKGLITPNVYASPAKHMSSAVDHIINFICTSQQEWAGAQAFGDFDLYLAPFVHVDKLNPKEVEQNIQRLVFNFNFPSRFGSQSPFVNVTLNFSVNGEKQERPAIIGGKEHGTLGDYIEEAMITTYGLIDTLKEGDSKHRPFTFPIPTIGIDKNFDWNERKWILGDIDLTYEIFELTALRGSFYFLNYLNGYIDPNSRFAMCCRLLPDIGKLCRHAGGIWTVPDETGSIGVVTINLPRLGYLAKDEDDFFTKLDERLEIARQQLMTKRKFLNDILRSNFFDLPITREYLGTYDNHYNTIGIVGMHECLMNLAGVPIYEQDGIRLAKKILRHILDKLQEFEELDNTLYNLEQTPAESTSYRLAMLDAKEFGAENICIQGEPGAYYYTNSTHVPYNAEIPLHEKIRIEAEFHPYFTGGCVTHIWLWEKPEVEALKKFVRRVLTNTKIAYLTITPTITTCRNCGSVWHGIIEKCPTCGHVNSLEVWSRIVGYYRPVYLWNQGKRAEFIRRIHYTLDGEIINPLNLKYLRA